MKKFLLVVILLLSLLNVGCAEPQKNFPIGVDDFSWKYFATLDHNKNIFYSPYGLDTALSILANGATGKTQKEILNALAADDLAALNDQHKNFAALIQKNYSVDNIFMTTNLLLVDKKISGQGLNQNFQRVAEKIYNSEVRTADFENNLAAEKNNIAHFVKDKTNGFIPNYNSIVTANTLTDLLNVVYFKGNWAFPFAAIDTHKRDFKNLDGSSNKVDMMSKVFEDCLAYHEDHNFKAIKLPYRQSNAAMFVILPADDNALDIAERWQKLSPNDRANFLHALKTSPAFNGEVVVRLPKFELDITNNLVDNLKAMGIENSFSGGAEFFNIVNGAPLKIENAQHRAKVKVDELGTEAAAITEISLEVTALPPQFQPPKVYFVADRPFLFLLRDTQANITLFVGVVNNL